MKVLKFGGRSLATEEALEKVKEIIKSEQEKDDIVVVLSARGDTTDKLDSLINKAEKGDESGWADLDAIVNWHELICQNGELNQSFERLKVLLKGIYLLGECPAKRKSEFLAFGEVLSCISISSYLNTGFSKL